VVDAEQRLQAAREDLARGDLKRAIREAWAAAAAAAGLEDTATLHSLLELVSSLEQQASGKAHVEAEKLRRYVSHALGDAERGTRSGSAWQRLFGRS
jgi:hypothetical protein